MAEDDAEHKKAIGHAILEQARRETPLRVLDGRLAGDAEYGIIFREWTSPDGRPLDQERVKKAQLLLHAVGWGDRFSCPKPEDVNAIIRDCIALLSNEEERGLYNFYRLVRVDREPKKDPPPPSPVLYRDEPIEFSESPLEISALSGLDEKDRVALENTDYKTLAAYVAQLEALDPEFDAELKAARTARHAFSQAAKPAMPLPTVAPVPWSDHPPGMTATEFVRKVYAPWIEAGVLTLKAIGECDPALYRAYSNRAHRHPDEAVALAKTTDPRFMANPEEAIERYRANARAAGAKHRAKRGALTQG